MSNGCLRLPSRSRRKGCPGPAQAHCGYRHPCANPLGWFPLLTALLSDIHGNLEALNACLDHARSRGAERFAFLGDLVGYGADARAVVEIVAGYAAEGAVVLKGNHDEAIEASKGYFNDASRAALEWARETLGQEQRAIPRRRCRSSCAKGRSATFTPRRRRRNAGTTSTVPRPQSAASKRRTLPTHSAVTSMTRCSISRARMDG